jgi:hypothetical protein
MFSLQLASLSVVRSPEKVDPVCSVNLLTDEVARAQVLFALHRFYDLDFSRVTISGELSDGFTKGDKVVEFSVFDHDGKVYTGFAQEGLYCHGHVAIHPKPGSSIKEALRRNPGEALGAAWNVANGFPDDYPRSVDCLVTATGALEITVNPCR